jgi:hypothetical protein
MSKTFSFQNYKTYIVEKLRAVATEQRTQFFVGKMYIFLRTVPHSIPGPLLRMIPRKSYSNTG